MAEQTQTVEVTEAVRNCAECKKPIKRARRYYREGAYYCNKNCYRKKMGKGKSGGDAEAPASQKPAEDPAKSKAKPAAEPKKDAKGAAKAAK